MLAGSNTELFDLQFESVSEFLDKKKSRIFHSIPKFKSSCYENLRQLTKLELNRDKVHIILACRQRSRPIARYTVSLLVSKETVRGAAFLREKRSLARSKGSLLAG